MQILKVIIEIISLIFVIYSIAYSTLLVVFVLIGSVTMFFKKTQKTYKNKLNDDYYLPISIIVPAYNESLTIISSVKSLLKLDYNLFEIVVVDDGSSDDTSEKLIKAFKMHKVERPIHKQVKCQPEIFLYESYSERVPVVLVKKVNGGCKADATNMGINVSRYPYFVCMDADSVLQRDSLKEISMPILEDDTVVAVGGTIRILNDIKVKDGVVQNYRLPKKAIPALQVLEYDRTFAGAKFFFNKIGGNVIISGAFGLFKKDAVIAVGGYDSASLGEDMDLVMNLTKYHKKNKIPFKIEYVSSAVCWTQGVPTVKDLIKQRKRWHIGMKQNLHKHREMIMNPKFGAIGTVTLPIFILFELLSPIVEVIGLISLIYYLIFNISYVPSLLLMMLIYSILGMLSTVVSYSCGISTFDYTLTTKDTFKIFAICLYETFVMHFVLLVVRFGATFASIKKKRKWEPITREAIGEDDKKKE